jgi:hypothetical protein
MKSQARDKSELLLFFASPILNLVVRLIGTSDKVIFGVFHSLTATPIVGFG